MSTVTPTMPAATRDLTRTVLAILFILTLIGASFWVLRPFLLAVIWAATIVVASWPLMMAVQRRLWHRRTLAVAIMTLALVVILFIPLTLAIATVVANTDNVVAWARTLATLSLPPPPPWLEQLPLVGAGIAAAWREVMTAGIMEPLRELEPYARDALRWLAGQAGSLGRMLFNFLLTTIIAAILFAMGETAADGLYRFGRRLAGSRGENAVSLAGQAIRSVALGVVVTALAQALLAGIGLAVAGIPLALLLTAAVFLLAVAQLGPLLILGPAVAWLYWQGDAGWGTALLVWSLFVGALDNVLRPLLIRRGANLPLLLIFAGVIGGLIAFGIVGIFIGPVVLAVTYTLLGQWLDSPPLGSESSGSIGGRPATAAAPGSLAEQ